MGQKRILARDLPPILLERSPGLAVFNLVSTWGLIAGLAAAAVHFNHVAVWAAAVVGVAIMQHRLTKLGHHSLHSDFSRSVAFNELIGRWFLLAPLMAPFSVVRFNHLGHHRNLGAENDYEKVYYDLALDGRASARGLKRWLLKMFLGGAIFTSLGRYVGLSRGPGTQSEVDPVGRTTSVGFLVGFSAAPIS